MTEIWQRYEIFSSPLVIFLYRKIFKRRVIFHLWIILQKSADLMETGQTMLLTDNDLTSVSLSAVLLP